MPFDKKIGIILTCSHQTAIVLAVSFLFFSFFNDLREKRSVPRLKRQVRHVLKVLGACWWEIASFGEASARVESRSVHWAIPLIVAGPTEEDDPVLQASSASAVSDPQVAPTARRCP